VSSHDGTVTVTNDGATILKAVHIDNPAAKVLVDIAKTQVHAKAPHHFNTTEA
jgi:T-complex protein 1 subunit beta